MSDKSEWDLETSTTQRTANSSNVGLAVALAALAALGAGIAIQQLLERRLSKPEMARLKFYRYLRERGHLES
jgi:F0F1-type ATP synthase membrane subunit c/vacuolar-type H+-ATPase subunit K